MSPIYATVPYLTPVTEDASYHWGPDGDCLAFWRRAVQQRLKGPDWIARVIECSNTVYVQESKDWLKEAVNHARTVGPFAAAIAIMRKVLNANDRDERLACFLSDMVLAKSMSWDVMLPLTALYMTKIKLRNLVDGALDASVEIELSILRSVQAAVRLAKQVAA